MDNEHNEEIINDDLIIGTHITTCGEIMVLQKGRVVTRFIPEQSMLMDKENDIIHSGSIFSAASWAAMAAINKKHSIMIAADVKFLSPIELGHEIIFKANAIQNDTKKCEVKVEGFLLDIKIFDSIFHIVVFDKAPFSIALEKLENF